LVEEFSQAASMHIVEAADPSSSLRSVSGWRGLFHGLTIHQTRSALQDDGGGDDGGGGDGSSALAKPQEPTGAEAEKRK
jgi:hypothetical protein